MSNLRHLDLVNGIVLTISVLIAALVSTIPVMVGLAAGGILMTLNLLAMRWMASRIVKGGTASKVGVLFLFMTKFVLLLGGVAAALHYLPTNPFAFGGGVALIIFTSMAVTALTQQPATGTL